MKTKKNAIVLIYVLFLVTISVIFATVLLNNNAYLYNITDLFEVDSKLLGNIEKDSKIIIDLDKELNANGGGITDVIKCPSGTGVTMSGTSNRSYIGTTLVYSGSIYCSGTYLGNSLKLYFNTGFTDFSQANYNGFLATLSGGMGVTNFADADNTLIDFSYYTGTSSINYAGTASDLGGAIPWTNPTNAQGNVTATFAQVILTSVPTGSNILSAKNFSFSGAGIPINAKINGITVQVERLGSTANVTDFSVQLTKNGTTGTGTNLGLNTSQIAKALRTYGGATNLWGTTWSRQDIVSSNFGVLLQYKTSSVGKTANVYRVNMTINYSSYNYSSPGGNYKTADGYDDNFNSDNYLVNQNGSIGTGTYFPNSYQDDDNYIRKTIYGFISPSSGFKKVFWNTTKAIKMINDNTNNNDSLNVKIGNVTSGYLYLNVDKNFEAKLVKFNRASFTGTNELIVEQTLTGTSLAGSGYLQNNAGVLSLTGVVSGSVYSFDFKNNDYAMFLKSTGTGTLMYNITGKTTTGTGIYINPIDDSDTSVIRYLGNEVLIDSNGRYIGKESEVLYKK